MVAGLRRALFARNVKGLPVVYLEALAAGVPIIEHLARAERANARRSRPHRIRRCCDRGGENGAGDFGVRQPFPAGPHERHTLRVVATASKCSSLPRQRCGQHNAGPYLRLQIQQRERFVDKGAIRIASLNCFEAGLRPISDDLREIRLFRVVEGREPSMPIFLDYSPPGGVAQLLHRRQ